MKWLARLVHSRGDPRGRPLGAPLSLSFANNITLDLTLAERSQEMGKRCSLRWAEVAQEVLHPCQKHALCLLQRQDSSRSQCHIDLALIVLSSARTCSIAHGFKFVEHTSGACRGEPQLFSQIANTHHRIYA